MLFGRGENQDVITLIRISRVSTSHRSSRKLKKKVNVVVNKASDKAVEIVEKSGGTVEIVS